MMEVDADALSWREKNANADRANDREYSAGCKHSAEQEKRDQGETVLFQGLYFRSVLIDLPGRNGRAASAHAFGTLRSSTYSSSGSSWALAEELVEQSSAAAFASGLQGRTSVQRSDDGRGSFWSHVYSSAARRAVVREREARRTGSLA